MRVVILAIVVFAFSSMSGQDVHFSQFWNAPVQINPAQTGLIDGSMRFGLIHRNQWSSVASPYKTFAFNGDYKIETSKSVAIGIGLNLYRDVAGDTKFGTTNAQLSVSSVLKVDGKNTISVGIIGGVVQKSMSPGDLVWGNQYQNGSYNSAAGSGENINMQPGSKGDFSAGIVYKYGSKNTSMISNDKITGVLGASYNHINQAKTSWTSYTTDTLFTNLIVHGNMEIGVGNTKLTVLPGFLVMLQGPSKEISAGMLLKYEVIQASKVTGNVKGAYVYAGAYTRLGDAVIPTIQLEYDKFLLGLSYDLNTSSLKQASSLRGGFEISLRFMMNTKSGTAASFSSPRSI